MYKKEINPATGITKSNMKAYIGTKTLAAKPMTLGMFNDIKHRPSDVKDDSKEGYFIQYPDGYESWSPKAVFEDAYREILSDDKLLDMPVFPSTEKTIAVRHDEDYGGAHYYQIQNSLGFNNGSDQYDTTIQHLQFVQKKLDGSIIPGVQSEQLALILLDRCKKLNARFPSEQNANMISGLQIFLDACKNRIEERIKRGVMGYLKK